MAIHFCNSALLVAKSHTRTVIAEKLIRWLGTHIRLKKGTKKIRAMKKELVSMKFLLFSTTFELIFGYRCIVELLTEAVAFIEKLESHLQSVRSIPQIPHMMNNMVSSERTEPTVFCSMKNATLFGCLGYFYVLID